jgi:peroxiredoxin
VALAAAAGISLVVVRGRFVGTPMRWTSCLRTGIFGFTAVLGMAYAVDACLVARLRNAVRERLVRDYPDSFQGRMVQGERRQREQLGEPFDLDFADAITGRPVSMKPLRGKVVVVHFRATWFGSRGREMDEMKKLHDQYHDKGVEFIGVSLDLPEEDGGLGALKAFVADRKIPWPQYYQSHDRLRCYVAGTPTNDFSESWGIDTVPTVFLIDAQGKLYATEAQGRLETLLTSQGKLERLITRLLKRTRASAPGR